MLQILQYVKPATLEEAYTLLRKNRNHQILGGMIWLKMQDRIIPKGIEIAHLVSDKIMEDEDGFTIGAMTSLHTLEMHKGLQDWCDGLLSKACKDIVGVQLRNLATIGGSVYARFGFSDILCALLVLPCEVHLYHQGVVSIQEFVKQGYTQDIITHLYISKKGLCHANFTCVRKSATDLSVLNVATAKYEDSLCVSVGATPKCAQCYTFPISMKKEEVASQLQEIVVCEDNFRATKAYRTKLVYALVLRALQQMEEEECK